MKNLRANIHRMPLEQLWDDHGQFGTRLRDLVADDLKWLIENGPVRFVVASVGAPLKWFAIEDCDHVWREASANIVTDEEISLDEYPNRFAYGASEWEGRSGERIILLEMYH